MLERRTYYPQSVFKPINSSIPRVMLAPPRYIQARGALAHTGKYLSLINAKRAGVLASKRGQNAEAGQVIASLVQNNIDSVVATFTGECSIEEIQQHSAELSAQKLDCLLAVGGGKCVDTGKCIAFRLNIPVVVIPTLASNDAPTSAISVLYTSDGTTSGAEFFPDNPAIVIVDTQVIANASVRHLVAGIGDAMAAWFEARICLNNENSRTILGTRPALAAAAIAEFCAATLLTDGEAARAAVADSQVNDALERVVEANILLGGLGFESGGLALAHAIAHSYADIPRVHANFMHGETVAMGTLAQLEMEGAKETTQVAEFFARVGLPIHLGQLSLDPEKETELAGMVKTIMENPFAHNMPLQLTPELIKEAILGAHALGLKITQHLGDDAYQQLHRHA